MNELYAFMMLVLFLSGILIGSGCTYFVISYTKVETCPVYVDDENNTKKKKWLSIRKKKNNREDDNDDNGLLECRLADEMSITEQSCIFDGTEISEVLQKQQDKVDNDFEYLSKNATK